MSPERATAGVIEDGKNRERQPDENDFVDESLRLALRLKP